MVHISIVLGVQYDSLHPVNHEVGGMQSLVHLARHRHTVTDTTACISEHNLFGNAIAVVAFAALHCICEYCPLCEVDTVLLCTVVVLRYKAICMS